MSKTRLNHSCRCNHRFYLPQVHGKLMISVASKTATTAMTKAITAISIALFFGTIITPFGKLFWQFNIKY